MPDPDNEAIITAEGGKRVTITIAELSDGNPVRSMDEPGEDPNTFIIQNGKYKLTITIAE